MPDLTHQDRARTALRAALESLILELRADSMDWDAAKVLMLDVEHRYEETDLAPPTHVLDPLRARLMSRESFDRAAVARDLQAMHDSV